MSALRMTNEAQNDSFDSRNGIEQADESIERLFGKQDAETVEQRRHYCAASRGKVCYHCKHKFDDGEPIYRARTYVYGRGFMRHYSISILSYCKSCAPYREYNEGKCKTCDRDVYFPWDRVYRRHVFCSEDCSKRHWANYRREKRLSERQKTCQKECGECEKSFTAPRSDTKFCSAACKQKAYRVRQGVAA